MATNTKHQEAWMHFKVYYDDETAQRLTAAPEAMAEKFAAITALTLL